MARLKLAEYMRENLAAFAAKTVQPAKELQALAVAYDKAADHVRRAVTKVYPATDMGVLKRYECASNQDEFRFQLPSGQVIEFAFREGDELLTPAGYKYGRKMYLADDAAAKALGAWSAARETFEKERATRLAAYKKLIAASRFAEDVIEAWPEAAEVLPKPGTAVAIVLDDAALGTIKRDRKERAKAAA